MRGINAETQRKLRKELRETCHPLSKPIALSPRLQARSHHLRPSSGQTAPDVSSAETRSEAEGHVNTEEIIVDEASAESEEGGAREQQARDAFAPLSLPKTRFGALLKAIETWVQTR